MHAVGANISQDILQILRNHIGSLQAYVDRVSTFEASRFEGLASATKRKYSVVSLLYAFIPCGYMKNDVDLLSA